MIWIFVLIIILLIFMWWTERCFKGGLHHMKMYLFEEWAFGKFQYKEECTKCGHTRMQWGLEVWHVGHWFKNWKKTRDYILYDGGYGKLWEHELRKHLKPKYIKKFNLEIKTND